MNGPETVTRFGAPWSREVRVHTVVFTLIMGIPAALNLARGHYVIGLLLLGILLLCVSQAVRWYELSPRELRIRRLWWETRWPLEGLTAATIQPQVMDNSWRTWGNGGVGGFTGRFSGSGLGSYRAYVTDASRTVVLKTRRGPVVVSPDRPDDFVAALEHASGQ